MKNSFTNIIMGAIINAANTEDRTEKRKLWVAMIGDLIGIKDPDAKEIWKKIKGRDAQDKLAATLGFIAFDEFVKLAEKSSRSTKH